MDFVLQSLFYPLSVSIQPFGCCLSGHIQVHLTLCLIYCSDLFCPVHLYLYCSMNLINLLFSWLMGFYCQQFIYLCIGRLPHFLFSKRTHFIAKSVQCMSRAVRERSEWFCWLTSRKNWHDAHTAPIAISSEAVWATVFLSSLEQSRIGAQFTASAVILPQISFPCQELRFTKSNGLEKCWRSGYCGTDVNQ